MVIDDVFVHPVEVVVGAQRRLGRQVTRLRQERTLHKEEQGWKAASAMAHLSRPTAAGKYGKGMEGMYES